MPLSAQNPARLAAAADYDDARVAVNYAAFGDLPADIEVHAMGPALPPGTPLGAELSAFIPYFIVMDTMNYQFWSQTAGEFVRYGVDGKIGALAMQHRFEAMWAQLLSEATGPSPLAYVVSTLRARIATEGVGFLFGDIPAAASRQAILLEVLDTPALLTVSEYLGQRVTREATLDWVDAQLLASRFPLAYGDRYLKKAQLTLMFIAAQYNAAHPNAAPCEVRTSACADYQLPKVLRSLGLLTYCPALARHVDTGQPVEADGPNERALRAATILACDALAAYFGTDIAAVDFWLWVHRNDARDAKFHLTETTAY